MTRTYEQSDVDRIERWILVDGIRHEQLLRPEDPKTEFDATCRRHPYSEVAVIEERHVVEKTTLLYRAEAGSDQ